MPRRLKPKDIVGQTILRGALVRIVRVPDLASMRPRRRSEAEAVFKHLQGTCKRVASFGQYGHVELVFTIRKGRLAGMHVVEIEPHFLRVQG